MQPSADSSRANRQSRSLPTPEPLARRHVLATLSSRFFIRCHAALIALWALSVGVMSSKLLWMAGIESLPVRYGLATLAAYGGFLLGVRCWLAYVGLSRYLQERHGPSDSSVDPSDLFEIPLKGGSAHPTPVSGHGGTFDGGGASADFTLKDTGVLGETGTDGSGALDALGDAGDALGFLVLVFSLLLAAALGAFYVASQGPVLLAEVAFEALLAGGMLKVARRVDQANWLLAAFRSTVVAALVVCVMSVGLGFALQHWFPGKQSLMQVLHSK